MTEPNDSRSERFARPYPTRVCGHCRGAMAGRKSDAEYCSNVCKRAAFDERARDGKVASVRRIKSGWSYVVHCDTYTGLAPGDKVRVG